MSFRKMIEGLDGDEVAELLASNDLREAQMRMLSCLISNGS